jgi:hypothetical protein
MNVASAIQLIEHVIYKPGWNITATDHTSRFEESILVKIEYPAQETSREMALQGYPENNRPYASFPIIVRDLDDTQLYRELLRCFMCIEEHEAREYLRIQPTGWAPFHPHAIDGMKRFKSTSADACCSVMEDLQFGIG